jgi:hypothetical protein
VDLVIHLGKPGLMFANDLGFETAVAITWDINIECAVLGEQCLAGIAVAAVSSVGWLVALT